MAKRKKKSSSGFLFMFILIAILGIIVFIYKDNFLVYMNMLFINSKEFVESKTKNNPVGDFFKKLPLFTKSDDKREIVKEKIKIEEEKSNKIKPDKFVKDEKKPEILKPDIDKSRNESPIKIIEKKEEKEVPVKKSTVSEKIEKPKKETEKTVVKTEINNVQKNKPVKNTINEKNNGETVKNREFRLFFSKINGNDQLVMTPVTRNVKYTDSPLTETLKVLLSGPSGSDKTNYIITNIPDNSKVLSVKVKEGIAYIDFSKEFEFNKYGRESTINQLKQIVYTATEFPTVKKVQFLIEGKVKNYLGGEGVIIDRPLSRNDFS